MMGQSGLCSAWLMKPGLLGRMAVLEVEITFAPSWAGWSTPHGKGMAVRLTSPTVEEVANMRELKTEWW
jgi:hypothetical protein